MERMKIAASAPPQVGGSLFTPEQLALVGTLAGPEAVVELTPFKQLYIETSAERMTALREALERSGLETYPAGPVVKSLIACNFCKGADDAGLDIARRLHRAIAGTPSPTPLKVGYAGCALGTSEPLLKDIGVVKMKETFDIYVGGEPKGLKTSIAKLLVSGVTEERLVPAVSAVLDYYRTHAKGKEKFAKFVDRVTPEALRRVAEAG
ncbi:nitrite reductase [Paenibacillus sp.]|uniref:nitrite reductase n=1 Tax=Paenibacillus sp. TaxID=58172 RepID=UPI002D672F14|nr:nitrite reductase [Paenibacillus sp.]HZG58732.1 nitrite reductase [Paenibacillus sp.]